VNKSTWNSCSLNLDLGAIHTFLHLKAWDVDISLCLIYQNWTYTYGVSSTFSFCFGHTLNKLHHSHWESMSCGVTSHSKPRKMMKLQNTQLTKACSKIVLLRFPLSFENVILMIFKKKNVLKMFFLVYVNAKGTSFCKHGNIPMLCATFWNNGNICFTLDERPTKTPMNGVLMLLEERLFIT